MPTPEPTNEGPYRIMATAIGGGQITSPGVTLVERGASERYAFRADEGWQLQQVWIDGKQYPASMFADDLSYLFANVTADHSITAIFAPVSGGPVDPANPNPPRYGLENLEDYDIPLAGAWNSSVGICFE
jgi:hypothetical protein